MLESSRRRTLAGRDGTNRATTPGSGPLIAPGPPSAAVSMNDVTRILSAIEQGDAQAAEQLLRLVYDELRKLAAQRLSQEKSGQTVQARVD